MEKRILTDLAETESISKEIIKLLEGLSHSQAEGVLEHTKKCLQFHTIVTPEPALLPPS